MPYAWGIKTKGIAIMERKTYIIGKEKARGIALHEAGVTSADFSNDRLEYNAGHALYELDYATDYMEYCCFVNAETGEVMGFDFRPRAA
jgi:uncharacterized membrane protein YkoI